MGQDNKYSDDRLIQDLCREGVDKDAYERLFHRYYPMVLNFVKGLVKNPVVAEDIAQNTFAKLWLNRFSLQPGLSVKNYLCVLSRNESINFLRSAVARNTSINLHNDSRNFVSCLFLKTKHTNHTFIKVLRGHFCDPVIFSQ